MKTLDICKYSLLKLRLTVYSDLQYTSPSIVASTYFSCCRVHVRIYYKYPST
jgi:hypothetical protein